MIKSETANLLNEVEKQFEQEENLVEIKDGLVVFAGDTHGDLEATENIANKYLNSKYKVVFLGDYVDRGPASAENLNTLLRLKLEHPNNLFLLMGNHEGRRAMEFSPADFWEGLDGELYAQYARVLSKLPLTVSAPNGIIALHGALPDVKRLEDINKIEFGSQQWQQITWGDWQASEEEGHLGNDVLTGRPQFGQRWFEEIMGRLGMNILIRSHQPNARQAIYGGRCITIFTSSAYRALVPERTIVIADLGKKIKTIDDLTIESI